VKIDPKMALYAGSKKPLVKRLQMGAGEKGSGKRRHSPRKGWGAEGCGWNW